MSVGLIIGSCTRTGMFTVAVPLMAVRISVTDDDDKITEESCIRSTRQTLAMT